MTHHPADVSPEALQHRRDLREAQTGQVASLIRVFDYLRGHDSWQGDQARRLARDIRKRFQGDHSSHTFNARYDLVGELDRWLTEGLRQAGDLHAIACAAGLSLGVRVEPDGMYVMERLAEHLRRHP